MVKSLLFVLLILAGSNVFAGERKCIVRQPDGSLEIRHIAIVEAHKAKDSLQRLLDREKGGRHQEVERCIEAWRDFASPDAREVEAAMPR